jgi:hypothetical protein
MSSFKAATEPKKEKNIKELTVDYAPFWQNLFTNMGISSPKFGAKLCYMGKEFGETRLECVRFWSSELSSGQDFFIEMFDWDKEHYDRANRKLYRLVNNPNWKLNPSKYVEVETSSDGKTNTTYAVRLSDLELVNSTPVTARFAEVVTAPSIPASLFEEEEEEMPGGMYSEKEDTHYSAMTMRDYYCIKHNVPFSNKKWLNDLIKQSKSYVNK